MTPTLPLVVLEHLGSLHAYEKLLVALIAFGPFVVLFVVVAVVRRRDAAEEAQESASDGGAAPSVTGAPGAQEDRAR